ncbi:conserved exported protein of unknown function [Bradyrhizobium sp. ORS 285]|uniref:hypothetical protein n=1 Tax=Bradyrhizobium sp. ORS 285 TaxID=115808 RepID=UPI0002409536|nr:hypothetical protein [Bradyrhizobium sp. ORS 285]CCD88125.1 conserved exported hypothetical protein [Bradyrhizobium sp. ORS 285]SMX58891.1 conserved exported protein of unknown function [Bradyrhizobium sp. ORS 285]
MKRVVIAVLVAVALGAAGFIGVPWYAQARAEREVEANFAQIRQSGATATHGKVAFDLWSRKLTIADVKLESASQPPASASFGTVTATGLSQPDSEHVSAASIELNDVTMSGQAAGPAALRISYKMPQLVVKDYAGPARFAAIPAGTGTLDVYRALVQQFVAINATSITVPRTTGTMDGGAATGPAEFTYSGLSFDGIKAGRIASYKLDEVTFTMSPQQPGGKADKMQGRIADIVHHDLDTNALLALLSPDAAKDDRTYRVYGKVTMGAYEINSSAGIRMRIDGATLDEFNVRPSRLQLPALIAALPTMPSGPPTPEQGRDLMERVAGVYEGMAIRNAEIRGLAVETPQGPFKLAAIRADLKDGKGDIAVEGLDGRAPNGPVKLGRFALKGFDFAGLMHFAAKYSAAGAKPAAADAAELFKMLDGVELKALTTPYTTGDKPVQIDNISLDWGQFVGPIPTKARLVAKMAGPLDPSNPALLPLLVAGIDTAAFDADLGLGWTESAGTFALEPFKLEVSNLVAASATVSLAQVPREVFTVDVQQAMIAAEKIEAAGLALTLRDLGAVDVLVANYARGHSIPRDAARKALVDSIKAIGAQVAADNADVASAVDALGRFVERPRQTFTLKLSPRAKVPAMQLAQLIAIDPPSALAQFKIKAQTAP